MTASVLVHPIALTALALVLLAAVRIGGRSASLKMPRPHWALAKGLICVLITSIALAAVSAYVTPEEARSFGVQPENYSTALRRQFIVLAVVASYASLLGASIVGIPLVVTLASKGWATVPIVVLSSAIISLLFGPAIGLVSLSEPMRAAKDLGYLVGFHGLLAFSFAVGIGLSWRLSRRSQ